MLTWIVDALLLAGLALMTVGVYGVVRFPDVHTQLHASSKAASFGVAALVAAALEGPGAIATRAVLVIVLLALTTPVAAHAIAQAARHIVNRWAPPAPSTRAVRPRAGVPRPEVPLAPACSPGPRLPRGAPRPGTPSPTCGLSPRRDHEAMPAVLDVRGLRCPLPLLRARRALAELGAGEALLVLATDPEAPIDLAALASDEGRAFVQERAGDGEWRLTLGPPPPPRDVGTVLPPASAPGGNLPPQEPDEEEQP